jgi:hypothetical protein
MTDHRRGDEDRRSRWLPAAVITVFALVLAAEVVVIALYGNYRNLIEESGVEVTFRPVSDASESAVAGPVEWAPGLVIDGVDGSHSVVEVDGRLRVQSPGELILRFRAADAGSFLEIDYRFGRRAKGARCRVTLARVASRYGVDYMHRRTLSGSKKIRGTFRHNLADHAGWFELSIDVNAAAAAVGFEIGPLDLVRD